MPTVKASYNCPRTRLRLRVEGVAVIMAETGGGSGVRRGVLVNTLVF
jgi:hypothetical protein